MPWGPAPIITQTYPSDAGPDDPALSVGDVSIVPQSLIDYYAGFGSTVIAAEIFRLDSDIYEWIALVLDPGGPILATGSAEFAAITELTATFTSGGVGQFVMCSKGSGQAIVSGPGGELTVEPGALLSLQQGSESTYGGVSLGRGLAGYRDSTGSSGATGAQAVMFTIPSVDFYDGRAYEFGYGARWLGSVATTPVIRFQRTNLAGALILGDFSHPANTTSYSFQGSGVAVNNSGATITVPVALTMGATVGTCNMQGSANNPRFMYVRDVGDAADYPNAPQI